MGHGHPQHSSAGVDGFGLTAWGMFNLWRHKIIYGESLPCIQKWQHYIGDGEYASAFEMPEVWDGLQGFDRHV